MAAVAHRQTTEGGSSRHTSSVRDRDTGQSVSRKKTTSSSRSGDDAKMIGQWRIGRTIGKGSSGRVKIAKHAITGKYAAIKIVPKGLIISSRMSMSEAGARADKVLLGIEREIVIMKLIDHPNVLNLYDVWETSSELYLIMEYVPGGELFDYLVKRGRLPVSEALHYFQQIIHAVDYCHRFNICHRDLKPENLLLDKDKNIKVADFGMAAWEAGERMLETSCGSPHYASPEIVAGKAYHGSSSDIWSCGIILFALLTGRLPFDDDNIRSLLQKVKVGVFEMPDEIKDPARDLLKKMLEKDPEQRITMPDILRHPFFVSRPPRQIPGRAFVLPPSLDEVERPVNSPEEIDADIMGNLKTLWSGASDDEILAALMSKEKTWEKAIYHLLIKYRNKHLENYNMDDEEDEAARARREARRKGHVTGPSPAKRKGGPVPTPKARLEPLGENETIQDRAPSPVARPQAPTPKKAAAAAVVGSYDSPAKMGNKLAAPRSPAGPRPNASRGTSYHSGSESDTLPTTPAIVLQEATPTKDMLPPSGAPTPRPRSLVEPPTPSAGMVVPPSPMLPSSPLLPDTPQLSPLNVPQVENMQLQHFFNEVANQLNTMNIRSSVASGSSSSGSAILGSDYHAYLAYAQGGGIEAINEMDPNQFADADDDETEMASVHSYTPSIATVHTGTQSPLIGLGLGGPPPPSHGGRPGLYPMPSHQATNTQRWSFASSTGSGHRGASNGSASTASTFPLESPMTSYTPQMTPQWEVAHNPLVAQRPAPMPPPRMASRPAPAPPAAAGAGRPLPPPIQTRPLERDGSYVMIDDADIPASDPSLNSWGSKHSSFSAHRVMATGSDAFGMLRKKSHKKVSIDPVPYTADLRGPQSAPLSSGSSSAGAGASSGGEISPKRSWFNNLFSFKPASCTLLSRDNIGNTRDKAKRLLLEMGVRVAVVEIDGLRGLKCRLDEVRDPQGTMTVVKGVRFKVEFARSSTSASTPGSGYNTLVSLTQEKGAQSSFKDVFNKLKAAFDAPSSSTGPNRNTYALPSAPMSARTPTDGSGARQQHLAAPPVRYAASAPTSPVAPQTPTFMPAPSSVQLPTSIRF